MRNRVPVLPLFAAIICLAFSFASESFAKKAPAGQEEAFAKTTPTRVDVPIQVGPEWRIRTNESGAINRRMYRRDFNLVMPTRAGDDPVDVARDFLLEKAGILGIQAEEASEKMALPDFEVSRSVTSGHSHHVTFQQTVGGVPVYRSEIVVNLTPENVVYSVYNESRPRISIDATPAISAQAARATAEAAINPRYLIGDIKSDLYVMDIEGTWKLVHRVTVPSGDPMGDWVVAIDAKTGASISIHDQMVYDTGTGQIFDPCPKTKLNDDTLTDQGDSDAAIPAGGYDTYPLPLLDPPVGGLYSLSGPWAKLTDHESPFITPPTHADPDSFIWTRSPDEFENVLVYWHITNMQTYFQDTLGLLNVNMVQQELDAHGLSGADNSHYVLSTQQIAYGDGGVDDAEDADVVIHEYGHAIHHNQVPNWGGADASRMGEGFGDYLAVSYSYYKNPTFQSDLVFNWDGHNEFWSGRLAIDSTLHYPESNSGVHTPGGTLWCSSLFNGLLVIGRHAMDADVLQSHFALGASATMPDAANEIVNADILLNGGANVQALVTVFDYWGMLDASTFIPQIAHTPLGDTEDAVGPYTVTATITAAQPLDLSSLQVIYDGPGPVVDTLTMAATGNPNEFSADIPSGGAGTYEYHITAADSGGGTATHPTGAPGNRHSFVVGPDVTPPVIAHNALNDQPWIRWPSDLSATITDNLALDDGSVYVEWELNSVSQSNFALTRVGASDVFTGTFPSDTLSAVIGDLIDYRIYASDASSNTNQAVEPAAGSNSFKLIAALGVVLVLDDDAVPAKPEAKIVKTDDGYVLLPPTSRNTAAGKVAQDMTDILNNLGYVAVQEAATTSDPLTWPTYDFIVSSSGANEGPVANAGYRTALETYVAGGGKLLVEGGEVGYDALSSPGYPTFAANVLHGTSWDGDNAGDINVVSGQESHPIMANPNAIPSPLSFAYSGYGDEDAVSPDAGSYIVMETATDPGSAGILVYDDNPAPASAQIVFLPFNFSVLADSATRSQLLENIGQFLLAPEGSPTGSITGNVDLSDNADNSGATVSAGTASVLTNAAGDYTITGLWPSTYDVTASKADYTTGLQSGVVVGAGNTPGINFVLDPVAIDTFCAQPGTAIEDNSSFSTILHPPESYTLSEVDILVDITHTYIGDLEVDLTSPGNATTVRLHDRSGGGDDDILTIYDEQTAPDGPGTMADFIGEDAYGKWTLTVADNAGGDEGTLNEWCLIFVRPATPTGVSDMPAVPRSFALRQNAPNPFNPVTKLRFDVPVRSRVSLSIYGPNGRLVRTVADRTMDPGSHELLWDGRSDSGEAVASGVYFFRFETDEFSATRKMTLVR